jgi:hypothetical protein
VVSGSPSLTTTATSSSSVAGSPYAITVTAGSLSAANYSFTSFVDGALTVTPAPLTVTASPASMVYGSVVPALSDTITGFVNGDTSSVVSGSPSLTTTATSSSPVAGSPYPITATTGSLSAANYSFSFVNGALTVTRAPLAVTASPASMVYGSAVPVLPYTITGFVNGDTSGVVSGSPSLTTTATSSSPVAGNPYPITITAGSLAAENYSFTSFVNSSLTVTPAPLTVAASPASMMYGLAVPALSYTITGFVNGDTSSIVSGSPSLTTTATSSSAVAGSPYPITVTAGTLTLSGTNYSLTSFVNGALAVTPAPLTVTASPASMVYGSAVPSLSYMVAGFVNGDTTSVVSGTPSLTTTATSSSPVAGNPYPITVTTGSLAAANYSFTSFVNGALTVTPAPLTVSASPASMAYGSAVPALGYAITGFVNGDTSSVVSGSPSTTTTAKSSSPVAGSPYPITITAGSLAAANYNFTSFVNGALTVTPAPLTVTASPASMVYGSAVPALSYTLTGFVNGDTASVVSGSPSLTTTATSSSAVAGNPYAITVTTGSLAAANYSFSLVNGVLTVTPAPLTVTASPASMVYGSVVPAFDDTITGFVNGDTKSVISGSPSLTTTATSSSPVASSPYPITVKAGSLSAVNYVFRAADLIGNDLSVTPAPLAISAVSESMVAGQAVPALAASFSGFVNGDTAADLTTPPTLTTAATSASPAGSYPITVSGAASPNYKITYTDGTLTVTPVPVPPATVQSISIQKIKTGKRKTTQVIVLQFNEALNAGDAQNLGAYGLATVVKSKKQKSKPVALSQATYNATAFTVTLTPRKPLVLSPALQLTVKAAGLRDALGRPLNNGANVMAILSKGGATVSAMTMERASARLALPSAAVDAVMEQEVTIGSKRTPLAEHSRNADLVAAQHGGHSSVLAHSVLRRRF